MAGSFNKVILLGNLTRDVELKSTQSGQSVANIGLAVNRRWRTPDGEQREETTFIDCEAWGKTAEMIAQYFSKGRPVLLEGRLRLDTWQDKDSGQNRSKLKVLVENFSFVDSKPGAGGGGGGGGDSHGGASRPARPTRPQTQSEPGISEDDIPF
ncbi:MAG: single-stranded DNA-binding protein [Phycisphaerales bacterium]|nr:single-stranded DNA-binding protein [Phycisphaerales bacterium]